MWFTRARAAGASFLLGAVAALVWLVVLFLGLWLDHHPDAPAAFGVAAFVLGLLVLPVTAGAALTWSRQIAAHPIGMSSLAGALAEWAFLLAAGLITTVTDFERQVAYLSVWMNRLEVLLVLVAFGLAGAIMGAAGGAVAARILRGRAARRLAHAQLHQLGTTADPARVARSDARP